MQSLIQLSDIAICVSNDFHLMHLNYKGPQFDTMHKKVLQKYYEEAADDYDTWAEAALMYLEVVPNANEAATRVKWQSVTGIFNYDNAVEQTNMLLDTYCAALLLTYDTMEKEHSIISVGISNTLQTRIEYWSKELNFFNARRL